MTINNIIVELDKTYQNEVNGFIVNSSVDNVLYASRIAKVLQSPSFTPIKRGDEVVCHHNVFIEKNTLRGRTFSDFHLWGKTYRVPFDLVYAYIRDGEFTSLSPFCFIKPIEEENKVVGDIVINVSENNSYKRRVPNEGIVVHPNQELLNMGVNLGDRVAFKPYTRHEFRINGELLYKMSNKDIVAIL